MDFSFFLLLLFFWDRPPPPSLLNVALEIKKGELIAIVGPVGSGKSTLLSAMLGEVNIVGRNGRGCDEEGKKTGKHFLCSVSRWCCGGPSKRSPRNNLTFQLLFEFFFSSFFFFFFFLSFFFLFYFL